MEKITKIGKGVLYTIFFISYTLLLISLLSNVVAKSLFE